MVAVLPCIPPLQFISNAAVAFQRRAYRKRNPDRIAVFSEFRSRLGLTKQAELFQLSPKFLNSSKAFPKIPASIINSEKLWNPERKERKQRIPTIWFLVANRSFVAYPKNSFQFLTKGRRNVSFFPFPSLSLFSFPFLLGADARHPVFRLTHSIAAHIRMWNVIVVSPVSRKMDSECPR